MTESAISMRTDRTCIRANGKSTRFVLGRITAPAAPPRATRTPVNLAIVVDRSGSMSGVKLETAKRAVLEALGHLQPTDRFSVVVYDNQIEVVIASTPATGEARRAAAERLVQIDPRGTTDLGGGWLRGCEQVASHLMAQGVNRCLLLTDGLANVGITDHDALTAHASELRARGVATSTFGVGVDFDERLLVDLADAGGGHFYYIEHAAQIRDAITSEVGETLEVVARNVSLDVLTRDEIEVEAITPHKVSRRGGRSVVMLGDLVSEQIVEVVLRLTFPFGTIGHEAGAILTLTDQDGVFAGEAQARLTWTYADSLANDHQPRDRDVDRVVARMFAARATQDAVRLNRAGDYQRAGHVLARTAGRIHEYAGSDPELGAIVANLNEQEPAFAAPMASSLLKRQHSSSSNIQRSRTYDGRSIKSERNV